MERTWPILLIVCAASIASAEPPKPAAPKSSAPAAISRAGQNSAKPAQPLNETKVICAYKGPGYFDAALALKLRDALSKPSNAAPAATPAADSHRPVAAGKTFISQNP
jgi:hypothetical protein